MRAVVCGTSTICPVLGPEITVIQKHCSFFVVAIWYDLQFIHTKFPFVCILFLCRVNYGEVQTCRKFMTGEMKDIYGQLLTEVWIAVAE